MRTIATQISDRYAIPTNFAMVYHAKMSPEAPAKIAASSPREQWIKSPKITLYALLTLI